MSTIMEPNNIYGDIMQQKHNNYRNCVVLIEIGKESQCGIILACADRFCCVLTNKTNALCSATQTIAVTFGDETEQIFNMQNVVVNSNNKLSILFLRDGIETVQAKQPVHFSSQDVLEDAVVYTLSYIPKACNKSRSTIANLAPASSYFRGGNAGVVGLEYDGANVFYHNCSAGLDVTEGSAVLDGSGDIIGMNLECSTGWTMALCLSAIKDEIVGIFPDTGGKTFAGIKQYLDTIAQNWSY